MSFLDQALSQFGGNELDAIGAKVGLSPDQVQAAVAALAQQHTEPGDTTEGAAAQTGLPVDQVQQVLEHLGGEGALGRLGGLLGSAGGEGGGIGGMLSGLFGKKE